MIISSLWRLVVWNPQVCQHLKPFKTSLHKFALTMRLGITNQVKQKPRRTSAMKEDKGLERQSLCTFGSSIPLYSPRSSHSMINTAHRLTESWQYHLQLFVSTVLTTVKLLNFSSQTGMCNHRHPKLSVRQVHTQCLGTLSWVWG